jgi:hypothetical protein
MGSDCLCIQFPRVAKPTNSVLRPPRLISFVCVTFFFLFFFSLFATATKDAAPKQQVAGLRGVS